MSKYTAYTMIGLARILGGVSLLAFVIFLFWGSLNLLDMQLDESGFLLFDAGLSLLFFIQHSGMVRKPFRRWLLRFIPEEYAGAITEKGHDKNTYYDYLRSEPLEAINSEYGLKPPSHSSGLCQTDVPCEFEILRPDLIA